MSTVDEVVRNHNIFINTTNKNLNDTNFNFTIYLPANTIKIENQRQLIRVYVKTISLPYSWPQINNYNNTININDIFNNNQMTIVLKNGIYSYPQLCQAINNQWGSTIVSFDINQLKFIFNWKTLIQLTFYQQSYQTFGFTINDQGIKGQTITSTTILNEKKLQNLYVNIDNLLPASLSNFDNIGVSNTNFKQSNILCQIPLHVEPWGILYYKNEDYYMDLSVSQLNNLTISMRDINGNYLYDLPNFEMVLNIQIINKINTDNQIIMKNLKSLNESTSMIKMMKYLKNKAYYSLK